MMLPVASVLRKELGLHHPTTDNWRQEANELRIQATQETALNIQGKDFKTFQERCCRRDAIKGRIDSDPANTTQYWQWFALCLYTMQPPLRASYSPDKHISKVNLSKLLSQAMASQQDNTPWPRPIQGLRKAHSNLVMSSNASYHKASSRRPTIFSGDHAVSLQRCITLLFC